MCGNCLRSGAVVAREAGRRQPGHKFPPLKLTPALAFELKRGGMCWPAGPLGLSPERRGGRRFYTHFFFLVCRWIPLALFTRLSRPRPLPFRVVVYRLRRVGVRESRVEGGPLANRPGTRGANLCVTLPDPWTAPRSLGTRNMGTCLHGHRAHRRTHMSTRVWARCLGVTTDPVPRPQGAGRLSWGGRGGEGIPGGGMLGREGVRCCVGWPADSAGGRGASKVCSIEARSNRPRL